MTALFDQVFNDVVGEVRPDTVARDCPVHGEYEAIAFDPDQTCPRAFCERTGEEL